MNKKIIIIFGAVAIVVLAGLIIKNISDQKYLQQFDYLKEPRIGSKPDQNMLVADVKGVPSEVSGKVIGLLYKNVYKYKDPNQSLTLRGRWQKFDYTDKEAIGRYGLPIRADVNINKDGIRSETWEYGQVAEILYVGSYADEKPTVEKLKKFISDNGYHIIGEHEEEYIKGPGMFLKGNPQNYRTIIRYRVVK